MRNETDAVLSEQGRLPKKKVRRAEIETIVDTGAVLMLLPQELVEALGLRRIDKAVVALADDRKVEMDMAGSIGLTILGRTMVTDCLVGPPGCEPLIGQVVLERLDLIPDPLKRTLSPRPESPYLPTLKLKPVRRQAETVAASLRTAA